MKRTFTKNMLGITTPGERNENDAYPTPPYVTHSLVKRVDLPGRIIEPCAGRGWMARELRKRYEITASDLYTYDDPLTEVGFGVDAMNIDYSEYDTVVTNPPYEKNMAEKLVTRALKHGVDTVAILQRLVFIESERRYKFFTEFPPALILPYSSRFYCNEDSILNKPIGGFVAYAWYVWKKGVTTTNVTWINTRQDLEEWEKDYAKDDR